MRTTIFESGNSQVVRIPEEFQFDYDEVEIFSRGDELVIRPLEAQRAAIIFDFLLEYLEYEDNLEREEIDLIIRPASKS